MPIIAFNISMDTPPLAAFRHVKGTKGSLKHSIKASIGKYFSFPMILFRFHLKFNSPRQHSLIKHDCVKNVPVADSVVSKIKPLNSASRLLSLLEGLPPLEASHLT